MKKINSPRELRGLAILSKGDTITHARKGTYFVKSQFGIGCYEVKTHKDKFWTCNCPDFEKRQMDCKHIFAVRFSRQLKKDVDNDSEIETETEPTFKPDSCPICNGENIIKRGKRKTSFGKVQRYSCKDCNHRFIIDKGFSRMKHDPKAITLTLDLYFKGISLRKICDHLKQFYNLNVNPTTPMRWIKKYLKLLSRYSEKHKANVSNIWHSDEMTVNVRKNGEKKYHEWIWNVMDSQTRYLLACRITEKRFVEDALKPLEDAKKHAKKRPDVIVTDGLKAYKSAILKTFYQRSAEMPNPHFRLKDFETKPNNNIVERLNATVRERLKVMRGIENRDDFTNAFLVYYNYIRPHMSLGGMTPAQLAKIPIDLKGNRWLKMIELATQQS